MRMDTLGIMVIADALPMLFAAHIKALRESSHPAHARRKRAGHPRQLWGIREGSGPLL